MQFVGSISAGVLDPVVHSRGQVVGLKRDYPDGYFFPEHFHEWDQLLYASTGALTVTTSQGIWVVPSLRAVWIPAGYPHQVRMSGTVYLRTLYLRPELGCPLPRSCCVVNVSSFFRELILLACEFPGLDKRAKVQAHLISVLLDQLQQTQAAPFQLRHPSDPRARRVAEILIKSPGDDHKMEEICKSAGGSKRTIERLFQRETGVSLGKWKQQLRLMYALQLIANEEKISNAAVDAGYSTPSAFISSFRNALGTTPGKYFHKSGRAN